MLVTADEPSASSEYDAVVPDTDSPGMISVKYTYLGVPAKRVGVTAKPGGTAAAWAIGSSNANARTSKLSFLFNVVTSCLFCFLPT